MRRILLLFISLTTLQLVVSSLLSSYYQRQFLPEPPLGFNIHQHPLPRAAGHGESVIGKIINVKDFGAKGDGITNDTLAFRSAINACDSFQKEKKNIIAQPQGIPRCKLIIPHGTYLIGGIHLCSNLNVQLDGNLIGSITSLHAWLSPESHWKSMVLLNASHLENVSIFGPRNSPPGVVKLDDGTISITGEPDNLGGTIDCMGRELWYKNCTRIDKFCYGAGRHGGGNLGLQISNSENIHIYGIQIIHGSNFPLSLHNTSALIENVGVLMPFVATRYDTYNVGGLGLANQSSVGTLAPFVHIRRSTIACGDDSFEFTGSSTAPTNNILVEDSYMGSGDGGNNHGHVHHITYRNIMMNNTHLGFFLKTGNNKNNWNGHVYAMTYENIHMNNVDNGFVVDEYYGTNQNGTTSNVSMHNIVLNGISGTVVGSAMCLDCALNADDDPSGKKHGMCNNFTFNDINLTPSNFAKKYGRKPGFYCKGPPVTVLEPVHNVNPFNKSCIATTSGNSINDEKVYEKLFLNETRTTSSDSIVYKNYNTTAILRKSSSKCGKPCECEITPAGEPCKGGWGKGCLPLPCNACDEVGCNWCINGTCQPFWAHRCLPFPT